MCAGQSHQHQHLKSSIIENGIVTHEDDDLVDTIDKLGREVPLYGTHNELPRVRSHGPLTHVVQIRCTEVAGHHDDRVTEVNDAALAVCEAAIVKDLKEQSDEFARRLLDLVNEDDAVRLAPHVFRQLPARVVPDVARRGTDESRDRVFLRVFRAIDADHRIRGIEQESRKLQRSWVREQF